MESFLVILGIILTMFILAYIVVYAIMLVVNLSSSKKNGEKFANLDGSFFAPTSEFIEPANYYDDVDNMANPIKF
jgi:hypothetical protein